mgnify:CR=1 FL=1
MQYFLRYCLFLLEKSSIFAHKNYKTIKDMCWHTYKPDCFFPKIAETDIDVIKVLRKNKKTPFQNYHVEFNHSLPEEKIKPEKQELFVRVSSGYHSYSLLHNKIKEIFTHFIIENDLHPSYTYTALYPKDYEFYKGYIPKGTIYYENEYGECVSETLVITEKTISPYISLDMNVLVDVDGRLHKKRFELNSKDKIVGVVIWENEDKLEVLSLLDKDWLPLGDTNNIITSELAKKYAEQITVSDYIIDEHNPDCYYRIKELMTGHVDWNMPYWGLHNGKEEMKSFYPETLTKKTENAYLPYFVEINQI